jgi:uncharacterized coiled-coil DUF342 family protein
MKNELTEVKKKLGIARTKLADLDTELGRLEGLAAPFVSQILLLQKERDYIQSRIDKLNSIIVGH